MRFVDVMFDHCLILSDTAISCHSADIANEANKEFKSFSISKEASAFDIANSLWELIGENNA